MNNTPDNSEQLRSSALVRPLTAQVLVFEPALTHSVWQDFSCRARSTEGLVRILRKGVKDGEWVGYRLLRIEEEHIGITWPNDTDQRRSPE